MTKAQTEAVVLHFARTLRQKDSWCGETHLQKALYFLQQLTGVPLPVRFRLWKHGPYSFDLSDQIGELIGYGLLSVSRNPAPYGPTLLATERAEKLLRCEAETTQQYSAQIEFVTSELARKGVVDLERLGTALLVTRAMPQGTAQERASKLRELKPHVTEEQALQAVHAIDAMEEQWKQAN